MSDEKTKEISDDKAKIEGAPATATAPSTDDPVANGDDDADSASPEAIARRVAKLGDDDLNEAQAREEERKLAARRAATKKSKKGAGLEVAASKKLSKIGTRAEPRRNVAIAADADPLIEKTAKFGEWIKQNQRTVQIFGALLIVGIGGAIAFKYYDHKHEVEASVLLTQAVADERAPVIAEPPKDDAETGMEPPPSFRTYEERTTAALKKYREVQARFPKSGAAILSRLAEASLLLDKREADAALTAFAETKASALAAADPEVKGRALEGIGFAHELKAAANPEDATKHYDEALKTYKELENTVEVRGFKELALYHQARIAQNKGETEKAREILLNLKERFAKPDESGSKMPVGPAFPYLKEVAMDRLREIDPSAAPKTQSSPGGSPKLNEEQIRKMMEDLKKKQKSGGGSEH